MKNTDKEIDQLRKVLFKYLSTQETPTIDNIGQFLKSIGKSGIMLNSSENDKNRILIYNLMSETKIEFDSDIMTLVGENSALFNAGTGTNFIYEVVPPKGVEIDVERFNAETYPIKSRVAARIQSLLHNYNCSMSFVKTQSNCLYQNLRTIDGDMPDLLARMLIARYEQDMTSIKDVTQYITRVNPYGFDIKLHGEVYQYKVKRFLQDCAMGMTPETPWTGIYDATGGQIVVKESGEVVCYHIYEINRFLDYLYKSTKFEGPSTSEDNRHPGYPRPDAKKKFFYGWLYKENEHYYIKLNLQIRFK